MNEKESRISYTVQQKDKAQRAGAKVGQLFLERYPGQAVRIEVFHVYSVLLFKITVHENAHSEEEYRQENNKRREANAKSTGVYCLFL